MPNLLSIPEEANPAIRTTTGKRGVPGGTNKHSVREEALREAGDVGREGDARARVEEGKGSKAGSIRRQLRNDAGRKASSSSTPPSAAKPARERKLKKGALQPYARFFHHPPEVYNQSYPLHLPSSSEPSATSPSAPSSPSKSASKADGRVREAMQEKQRREKVRRSRQENRERAREEEDRDFKRRCEVFLRFEVFALESSGAEDVDAKPASFLRPPEPQTGDRHNLARRARASRKEAEVKEKERKEQVIQFCRELNNINAELNAGGYSPLVPPVPLPFSSSPRRSRPRRRRHNTSCAVEAPDVGFVEVESEEPLRLRGGASIEIEMDDGAGEDGERDEMDEGEDQNDGEGYEMGERDEQDKMDVWEGEEKDDGEGEEMNEQDEQDEQEEHDEPDQRDELEDARARLRLDGSNVFNAASTAPIEPRCGPDFSKPSSTIFSHLDPDDMLLELIRVTNVQQLLNVSSQLMGRPVLDELQDRIEAAKQIGIKKVIVLLGECANTRHRRYHGPTGGTIKWFQELAQEEGFTVIVWNVLPYHSGPLDDCEELSDDQIPAARLLTTAALLLVAAQLDLDAVVTLGQLAARTAGVQYCGDSFPEEEWWAEKLTSKWLGLPHFALAHYLDNLHKGAFILLTVRLLTSLLKKLSAEELGHSYVDLSKALGAAMARWTYPDLVNNALRRLELDLGAVAKTSRARLLARLFELVVPTNLQLLSFLSLPPEITSEIFTYLDPKDVITLGRLNKKHYHEFLDPVGGQGFWHRRLLANHGRRSVVVPTGGKVEIIYRYASGESHIPPHIQENLSLLMRTTGVEIMRQLTGTSVKMTDFRISLFTNSGAEAAGLKPRLSPWAYESYSPEAGWSRICGGKTKVLILVGGAVSIPNPASLYLAARGLGPDGVLVTVNKQNDFSVMSAPKLADAIFFAMIMFGDKGFLRNKPGWDEITPLTRQLAAFERGRVTVIDKEAEETCASDVFATLMIRRVHQETVAIAQERDLHQRWPWGAVVKVKDIGTLKRSAEDEELILKDRELDKDVELPSNEHIAELCAETSSFLSICALSSVKCYFCSRGLDNGRKFDEALGDCGGWRCYRCVTWKKKYGREWREGDDVCANANCTANFLTIEHRSNLRYCSRDDKFRCQSCFFVYDNTGAERDPTTDDPRTCAHCGRSGLYNNKALALDEHGLRSCEACQNMKPDERTQCICVGCLYDVNNDGSEQRCARCVRAARDPSTTFNVQYGDCPFCDHRDVQFFRNTLFGRPGMCGYACKSCRDFFKNVTPAHLRLLSTMAEARALRYWKLDKRARKSKRPGTTPWDKLQSLKLGSLPYPPIPPSNPSAVARVDELMGEVARITRAPRQYAIAGAVSPQAYPPARAPHSAWAGKILLSFNGKATPGPPEANSKQELQIVEVGSIPSLAQAPAAVDVEAGRKGGTKRNRDEQEGAGRDEGGADKKKRTRSLASGSSTAPSASLAAFSSSPGTSSLADSSPLADNSASFPDTSSFLDTSSFFPGTSLADRSDAFAGPSSFSGGGPSSSLADPSSSLAGSSSALARSSAPGGSSSLADFSSSPLAGSSVTGSAPAASSGPSSSAGPSMQDRRRSTRTGNNPFSTANVLEKAATRRGGKGKGSDA